jgi:hypothetical protein
MYCSDKDDWNYMGADQSTFNTTDHSDQDTDTDICSPFCQCSCCHGFVLLHFTKLNLRQPVSSDKQIAYSENFSSAFSGNIWQPPKIS